ncbi:hypothetical protein Rhe02_36980 [Rhizocola hellebori]|uniref:Uncharacterized protein n=1 Tax=Rhizocola hellebori TaxID=1392758 RepID=A0A8J3Q9L2_9ACTN|nr:hypothetical protein [Rhizocola hellebori]GIH05631.1 hypothetical protein Rhe02_36980 [Rhizocola hellebori]
MPSPAEGLDLDDILVVIMHPFGNLEVTLRWWIENGPGPRPFVRPGRVRSRSTGQRLPFSTIPLSYRNTRQARQAIREGHLPNPWPTKWRLPSAEEEIENMRLAIGEERDELTDEELGSVVEAYDDEPPGAGRHRAV